MHLQKYFLKFSSSKSGLTQHQADINRKRFGANSLTYKKRDGFFLILLRQFGGFFSIILSIAATILLLLGEYIDFYIILVVVLLNVVIETVQRYRSDSIFETLVKALPAFSLVLRNGSRTKVESGELVVGDIVVLVAGDKVPADGLVFFAQDFRVDEAILTGESRPIHKEETQDEYNIDSIIDNRHVVFSGTYVLTGEAHVLLCRVGNDTQIGAIAGKISTIDSELPIHKSIRRLSFSIFSFVLALSLFAFFVGLARDYSSVEIFKTTVALFVSAIPESLPVMLTLVLAYGFKRMGDRNVLVRKMQSLDVLGQIDVLALDKTGTITRNQMKVEKVYSPDGTEVYVTGEGYEPKGSLVRNGAQVSISEFPSIRSLVEAVVMSADGTFGYDPVKQDWSIETGDPTEVSLLVLGQKVGITKDELNKSYVLKDDIPFSGQKMYHESSYLSGKKEYRVFTGAPEAVLAMCGHAQVGGSVRMATDELVKSIKRKVREYSLDGYRVIASCMQSGSRITFLGMVALSDSVRSDVRESVEEVYRRGVDIVIITGDHKEIALQVGRSVGLRCDETSVLTGEDMKNLNDRQLQNLVLQKNIFARVTPQQKLKILELFKRAGKVVAMTGDGVNDSLALVKADIGIAMGKSSSEAAKEASDIVLLDNKFGSIVYGIDEGKNIFANIRKTIMFLLSTNFAEVFVVVCALTLALPLPLSAIAILWLNLVTDTFLVIGFAFERGKVGRRNSKHLIGFMEWARIIYLGMIMTCVALLVFMHTQSQSLQYAQGMVLLTLIFMQWFNVLNIRAGSESAFGAGRTSNPVFFLGWLVSVILTFFAFESDFMRFLLGIQPISVADWLYAGLLGSSILWLEELRKLAGRYAIFGKRRP
jgi:Ca2+-transporting ATPase